MMLTLEDGISLDDHYAFKSSPESCGDNFTDYMEVTSDEDFMQQLSSDLDIPLLLNPGDDEFNVLNSYFDKPPDEILSNVSSPLSTAKLEDISKELKELQQLDFSQWGPEAFPNLTEVKTENSEIKKESSDGYSSSDSSKSSSSDCKHSYQTHPLTSNNACNGSIERILQEPQKNHEVPSPEGKQYIFNYEPVIFSNTNEQAAEKQLLHNHVTNAAKLTERQVPIRPRAPIAPAPKSPQSQVVLIKNEPCSPKQNTLQPKVVFLENIQRMSMTNIPQITQSKPVTSTLSNISSSMTPVSLSSVIINTSTVPASVRSTLDPKAFKRQQRKIRNRESACLSRKKKKEYLTALEEQVRNLSLENQRLKNENSQLKERLAHYENRPASPSGKTVKSSVVLCVVLFVLGLNLDFINNTFNSKIQMSEQMSDFSKISDHHGRSLLWAPKTDSIEAVPDNTTSANLLSLSMCPADINQTESARLVLELERWIGKPDNVKSNNISINNQKPKLKLKRKKFRFDTSVAPSSLGKRIDNYPEKPVHNELRHELQVFSPPPDQMYSEFFEAINRQNDTFYVVSFSQHHMLLPALSHNNTRRPKMSLIMPSVIPDDFSGHPTSMPLMQIDCEVLDTRLIHVEYGTIPEHLRNSTFHRDQNTTDPGRNSPRSSTNKRPYKPYFMKKAGIKYKPFSNYYDLN